MPGTGAPSRTRSRSELLHQLLLARTVGHVVGDAARNDAHTVRIADQHVAGKHRDPAAGDRILHGGGEMDGQAGGRGTALQKVGNAMAATAAASRIGPSATNAATPRTLSRVIRMSPRAPAPCSPRQSQTSTWPGGQASIALRWG